VPFNVVVVSKRPPTPEISFLLYFGVSGLLRAELDSAMGSNRTRHLLIASTAP